MVLIGVFVVVVALVSGEETPRVDCVEYCRSPSSGDISSDKCDCGAILSELQLAKGPSKWPQQLFPEPYSEPQAPKGRNKWPGLLQKTQPSEYSSIFYQPAKRIANPGLSLLDQPFHIINPAFKISFDLPKKDNKKRTPTNEDNTKVPIYLDIVLDSNDSERAASSQLSSFSKPLKEDDLSDCIDLHILSYSRYNKNNRTSELEINTKSLAKYSNLSDTEIKTEIERKCSHAINLVKDSIKEIMETRPKKKDYVPEWEPNEDKDSNESKQVQSGDSVNRSGDFEDSPMAETTRKEIYSLPTEQPRLPVYHGGNLSNSSEIALENQIKEFFQTPSNVSEITLENQFKEIFKSPSNTSETTYSITGTTQIPKKNSLDARLLFEEDDTNNESSSSEVASFQHQTTNTTTIPNFTTEKTIAEEQYPEKLKNNDETYGVIGITRPDNDNKHDVINEKLNLNDTPNFIDGSKGSVDLSKVKAAESENIEDTNDGISLVTAASQIMNLSTAEYFNTEEPIDIVSGDKSKIINASAENYSNTNHSRIVANPPTIQKIVTTELSNDTVISDGKGTEKTEPLLYNDFNDKFNDKVKATADKPHSQVDTPEIDKQDHESIVSEIAGDLYFNFKNVNVPARFVQNPDGKVIVGIDGTSFCDKLQFDSDNKKYVLFSKLCEYVSGSINVTNY